MTCMIASLLLRPDSYQHQLVLHAPGGAYCYENRYKLRNLARSASWTKESKVFIDNIIVHNWPSPCKERRKDNCHSSHPHVSHHTPLWVVPHYPISHLPCMQAKQTEPWRMLPLAYALSSSKLLRRKTKGNHNGKLQTRPPKKHSSYESTRR
ncbi:hypothetical protein BX600DRAFT_313374 [Xylariales sp. PMI_506]|nr:hypothetical protein BX600DRAFT_313374 [Xylariales sp. PMI_506]